MLQTALFLLYVGLIPGSEDHLASQFRHGPSHQGAASGPASLPGELAWRLATRGKLRGTPVVREGKAYVGSEDGGLYCVSLVDGRLLWRFEAGCELSSSPALAKNLVLFLGRDGNMRALNADTGKIRWVTTLGGDLSPKGDPRLWDLWVSSPLVEGNRVFIGGGDGKVHALELESGKSIWQFTTGGRVRSSPSLWEGRVFVGSFDGNVYAIDAVTGQQQWKFSTGAPVQSSPALAGGTVFVGSRAAAVFALDARTGTLKWRSAHPNGSWVLGSPAVAKGKVVVGSSDEHFVQALDQESGQEIWRFPTRGRVLGSPTIQGDVVLVGTEDAFLFALDLESGLSLGQNVTEGPIHSSPVPADELILVASDDSHLSAFRVVRAPTLPPPEPPHRLDPITGSFSLGASVIKVSRTEGRLRIQIGNFPPALGWLTPTGSLHVPTYGLELKVQWGNPGDPAQLALVRQGQEKMLKRLPSAETVR